MDPIDLCGVTLYRQSSDEHGACKITFVVPESALPAVLKLVALAREKALDLTVKERLEF